MAMLATRAAMTKRVVGPVSAIATIARSATAHVARWEGSSISPYARLPVEPTNRLHRRSRERTAPTRAAARIASARREAKEDKIAGKSPRPLAQADGGRVVHLDFRYGN